MKYDVLQVNQTNAKYRVILRGGHEDLMTYTEIRVTAEVDIIS